ncbi:MAG: hypothetical protein ACRD4F_10860, partial [Candidatus Angelobacter sp.]
GYPAIPLSEYTVEDVKREYFTEKSCAPNCTISCVHQTSLVDFWRDPQTMPSHQVFRSAPQPAELVQIEPRSEHSVMAD